MGVASGGEPLRAAWVPSLTNFSQAIEITLSHQISSLRKVEDSV
jgi:hypothetical protein